MALVTRQDKSAPGALAAQLDAAKQRHDAAVEKAVAEFEVKRASVIQRATQRVDQIVTLQKELAAEQADLQSLVAKA